MKYIRPDYYPEFVCIAGDCPNTCCAGWQIEIDEKSLVKYVKFQKSGHPFANRLFNGVDWREGVFEQGAGKRCEFLNEDNLCDIYSEAGKEFLCKTCKTYPRHIEEFPRQQEISLALSCPEVAKIILEKKEPVKFVEIEKTKRQEKYGNFNTSLFNELLLAREFLIEIVQMREQSISDRIDKMLLYGHDLQLCIQKEEWERHKSILRSHRGIAFKENFLKKQERTHAVAESPYVLLQKVWELFLGEMEVLQEEWPKHVRSSMNSLYGVDEAYYNHVKKKFLSEYTDWEYECEQLLVYWIFTYFLGAVYDGRGLAKLKFAIVNTMLIRELSIAKYIENGEEFSKEDMIQTCISFSREMEHSVINLERVEKALCQREELKLKKILAMNK